MSRILKAAIAAGSLSVAAAASQGALVVEMQEAGGPTVSVNDNGIGDLNPSVGVIQYSSLPGTFVNFDTTLTIGVSNSPGDPLASILQITSILIENNGTAPASMQLRMSDNNFSNPSGSSLDLKSSIGGTFLGPIAGSTADFTSYGDASNALFGLATATPTLGFNYTTPFQQAFSGSNQVPFGGSLYSLSNYTNIMLTAFGQANISGTTSVVPEPASLAAIGILGAVLLRRR